MMLTGDLNMASVEWIVQYKVTDPYKYLFKVRSVEETLRDLNEAVMREIVGDRTINEVLTVGRIEIADSVKQRLQLLTNQYAMGITIDQVVLQDVNPPDPVKPSFNAVNEAQQEREKLINEARSEYNRVIPRAKGEAEKTINEAHAYSYERINRSKGEAARFTALFEAYRQAPEVTRRRIYLETLSETLPKVGRKVIIDAELEGLVPLLPLGGTGGLSGGTR
jgi:membrane protease subunit HflK